MNPRVALLADHLEESWTSMDHYTAMLGRHLAGAGWPGATVVRPRFHRRLDRLRWLLGERHGHTLDRYLNRYVDYPRAVARERGFELFHVMDQTYAHVVTRLPAERTVVTCHDLDFAHPPAGTRLTWLVRATGALSLRGIRTAARVVCDSETIRQEVERLGLAAPERLEVVPLGVEEDFSHAGPLGLSPEMERRLAGTGHGPLVLHVGAMVPRKRLDLVLRTFAAIRRGHADAVLVRAGGPLTPAMLALADDLGVLGRIVDMPFLTRAELAALYRRADVFLLCSENEGFGLPVLEAMASGLPVVSRDIPAVREVGDEAIRLVSGQDPDALAAAVIEVLRGKDLRLAMRQRGVDRAVKFRWAVTAERMARIYRDVHNSLARGCARR